MPINLLSNIVHLSSTALDAINDPVCGASVASGTGASPYPGQLGAWLVTNEAGAANYSSSSITLHAGIYQYVQFKSGSTASNAKGQIVFWGSETDRESYIVTPDASLTDDSLWAGLTLGAPSKGNYGWIQIAGAAWVKFKSSITKATPAVGDLVVVDAGAGTPTNTADVLADATGITSPIAKLILGVATQTPVGAASSLVLLRPQFTP